MKIQATKILARIFTSNEEHKKLSSFEITKNTDQNYFFHSDSADLLN